MREVILEMNELSDSREVLEKRIPRFTTIFIIIIVLAISAALVWAHFGTIETYVAGMGEIRPTTVFTLTVVSGGKIAAKNYANGETVKKGEKILEFDSTVLKRQKESLEKQTNDLNDKISCCDKLISSINMNNNELSSTGVEATYYAQYQSYQAEAQNAAQLGQSANQVKATYLANAQNTKETYTTQRDSLDTELISLEQALDDLVVTAPGEGVIEWAKSFQIGESLTTDTYLGTLTPSNQDLQVVLYIAENDIASIERGQKVEYTVNSAVSKEYYKLSGEIVKISTDATVSEAQGQGTGYGQRFYKAEATLSSENMTNINNEAMRMLTGMSVQAHVISGQQSVLDWLLEKTGFK